MSPSTIQEIGMVNPPRKAKRLRELALKEVPTTAMEFQLSNMPGPSQPSSSAAVPAAPRRRGRKPAGSLSKSAREQLRKTNHSVIEKRRREKINEALAALRQLVPNDKPTGESKEKKDKEEREFKLEILERTVDYLQKVVARVRTLEQGLCGNCSSTLQSDACPIPAQIEDSRPAKRRRKEYDEDNQADGDSDDDEDMDEEPTYSRSLSPVPVTMPQQAIDTSSKPNLPSISSWISGAPTSPVFQLPSPPQSVPFAPTHVPSGALPGLVLPPPVNLPEAISAHRIAEELPSPHPFPGTRQGGTSGPVTDRRFPTEPLSRSSPYPSPPMLPTNARSTPNPLTISNLCHNDSVDMQVQGQQFHLPPAIPKPSWSGEDQTAVNLLLNFSSRSSTTSSDERTPDREDYHREEPRSQYTWGSVAAHTPRSMLGMHDEVRR
ncbi:hypothetical protein M422DRAFT_33909 [Sphaerobolus stellatus SS14]|uniref:Unplaced genomic scaffold SPHSTscaffold_97, whole genome shotgun sequence n=1 Tax=Sphaerobolus stellatus (strain SS14) TaxID=990650 RepID=A0A0C9VIC2_SPHS4|nr:hypothetical protein M422DRAFT_33909 [Sphaerobolus stellatus SS14]